MTHNTLRSISLLLAFSMVPALRAETVTWDSMKGKSVKGSIEVTLLSGEKWKRTDTASFTATDVKFVKKNRVFRRDEVKELVVTTHHPRAWCCEGLGIGAVMFPMTMGEILTGSAGADTPVLLLLTPFLAAWSAVTAPPFFLINGVRQLVPATVVDRVAP